MGMDNLPEPGPNTTAEICIEIEGTNKAGWKLAFDNFKVAVRLALDDLENAVPAGGKKIWTSGSHKKKR